MVDFIKFRGYDHIFWYTGPWFYWLLAFYLLLPIIAYSLIPLLTTRPNYNGKKSIAIFVLGDLGHSPRMTYHAKSFSNLEYYVNLCGYLETQPSNEILDDLYIELHEITVTKNKFSLPFFLFSLLKILSQLKELFTLLFKFRGTDFILIQNPPSIPLLLVVVVFVKLFSRNTKIIIDWHNLNYTILNLRYNNMNHPFVKFVKGYERYIGNFADLHITVTEQMKIFLKKEFDIKKKIITLYDRPDIQFKPLESPKSEVLKNFDIFDDIPNISKYKILVSSTSFTPDEDFGILLEALKKYEDLSDGEPPILLIVTGKGPLKERFQTDVMKCQFSSQVIVKTAWLPSADYPKLLKIADLGISLHTSSSGIDLPMKIVDMFGCGIPVISLNFPAVGELVIDRSNGLICWDKISQLDDICRLLKLAFTDENLYNQIKAGAMKETKLRWHENWSSKLGSIFG